jgi:lysophospholipase L1-like esterase
MKRHRHESSGHWASKVALVVGSFLVFGAIAYAIVQIFFSSETDYYHDPTGNYELSYLDHRGRRLSEIEGALGLMMDPFTFYRNYPDQRTDCFTIDANGFRGGIRDAQKPKVVILGGSAAFGRGLRSDDETFAARLNQRVPAYTFINAGVTGFASGQELAYMIHYLDRLRPAVYIAFDGWNDLVDYGRPRKHFGANGDIYFAFAERLHQYHLLMRKPTSKPWPFPAAEAEKDAAEHLSDVVRIYESNLEKMHAWARSRGARFVVVFQPIVTSRRNRSEAEAKMPLPAATADAYRDFIARAKAFCRTNGIPCCDVNEEPAFQQSPKTLFLDVVHMSADGHEVVAGILQRVLGELGR